MLRVEKLSRSVGAFRLQVDGWRVCPGAYVVLVGPSGAGKTLLLETLAGLGRPEGGRIWIDGVEASELPPDLRGIGFVYQDCWLFPHMSVRQNIDFARTYHRRAGREHGPSASELAEMLGIGDLLDRRPPTLSGGERQRVALARALSIRPRLMFLDEPLGMLDPVTREAVAAELRNCHRRSGTTTIHVTHDHAEARSLADEVAVMLQGTLEQFGPAEEVFRQPRNLSLARFLGCENLIECESKPADLPGKVRLRLGGNDVLVSSAVSGRVLVCVRPEEVVVQAPDHAEIADTFPLRARGVVLEAAARGPLIRLVVDVDGRRWISLVSRSGGRGPQYSPGESVVLAVSDESFHLVPAET